MKLALLFALPALANTNPWQCCADAYDVARNPYVVCESGKTKQDAVRTLRIRDCTALLCNVVTCTATKTQR
jgi:hypothetical protein